MKTLHKILALIALILVLCIVSFYSFSDASSSSPQSSSVFLAVKREGMQGNANTSATGSNITSPPSSIQSNGDYLATVNAILANPPDSAKDKVAIYNIQGQVSSLGTTNSATLLGEIGNPNNLINPRLFLQYMNWFGSNCPVDSGSCPGLANA